MSTTTPPAGTIVFNRKMKQAQKRYAAELSNSPEYDYFRLETANRLISRLQDVDREFPKALEIGANSGQVYKELINYVRMYPNDKRPGSAMVVNSLFYFHDRLCLGITCNEKKT
ncbi:hypothetical protein RFI_06013 [Reticulomyxa filosa]|uniref:Uncharacterized protein n=1 Tax=Reticulomyxa filosa TaxID=46433 RepID=X6P0P7_RETFI|nr:hypothetical protein RFI_06013 [Reticulomyxa filosa]|eukprot:ETO31107.1 hypothetical protein RFI_06013 [Reticulomyxa filosa]